MDANTVAALSQSTAISIFDLLLSISVSFLICLWVAFVYRFTHRGLNYERSFLVTMVITGPVVGIVIMLIGSNLALSLGLVGALSIIRFRNVIKDSRDMAFLFWIIAVGLGSGTYNWKVVIVASLFIGAIVFLLYFLHYGKSRHSDCVLVLRGEDNQPIDDIQGTIEGYTESSNMRSFEIDENQWEIVIELRFKGGRLRDQKSMLNALRALENIRHASIMTPLVNLPL